MVPSVLWLFPAVAGFPCCSRWSLVFVPVSVATSVRPSLSQPPRAGQQHMGKEKRSLLSLQTFPAGLIFFFLYKVRNLEGGTK